MHKWWGSVWKIPNISEIKLLKLLNVTSRRHVMYNKKNYNINDETWQNYKLYIYTSIYRQAFKKSNTKVY